MNVECCHCPASAPWSAVLASRNTLLSAQPGFRSIQVCSAPTLPASVPVPTCGPTTVVLSAPGAQAISHVPVMLESPLTSSVTLPTRSSCPSASNARYSKAPSRSSSRAAATWPGAPPLHPQESTAARAIRGSPNRMVMPKDTRPRAAASPGEPDRSHAHFSVDTRKELLSATRGYSLYGGRDLGTEFRPCQSQPGYPTSCTKRWVTRPPKTW